MRYFLKFFFLLILFSCAEKNDGLQRITDAHYLQNNELFNNSPCFSPSAFIDGEGFVIRNEQEYLELADSLRTEIYNCECDTATLMEIDFDEYTLLGILTGYGGCYDIVKNISLDEGNKTVIYKIDFEQITNDCPEYYIFYINLNLALIPKIPESYEVEFRVTRDE